LWLGFLLWLGRKHEIEWECNNGGQLWPGVNAQVAASNDVALPSAFCSAGFPTLSAAFTGGLFIDLIFQIYMFFLMWRFTKRLEHYRGMKGPFSGGYYNA
jgi:hypothetical protein